MIKAQLIAGAVLLTLAAGAGAWGKIESLRRERAEMALADMRGDRDRESARAERNAAAAAAIQAACEAGNRAVDDAARRGGALREQLNRARDEVDNADPSDPLALDRLLERLRAEGGGPPRSPGGAPANPGGAVAPARDP